MFNCLWNWVCSIWMPVVKKKRTGAAAVLIAAGLMAAGGMIYVMPHNIIDTEEIYKIEISETTISDQETIKAILEDLNNSEYRRGLTSGVGGYSEYSVRGYDENGNLKFHIEIKDERTVDTGMFWETRIDGSLNLSLYQDAVFQKVGNQVH